MATQTRKRTRAKFVSKQTVEQVGASLQNLPEKTPDNHSLRQAVEQLRGTIEAALAKGYSYEDLIPILAQQGIDIQPSTLKRYILTGGTRSTTKRSSTKTRQTRKKPEPTVRTEDAPVAGQEEAPAPAATRKKRTKAAAEEGSTRAATETTQAQAEPAKQSRSRRASTASSAPTKTKSRTTSTRGRKTAKA